MGWSTLKIFLLILDIQYSPLQNSSLAAEGVKKSHRVKDTTVSLSRAQAHRLLINRLISFSGGFLRGVLGNPNFFPILVQGDAVHGISPN